MMSNLKKLCAVLLCLVMVISVLAACNDGAEGAETETQSQTQPQETEEQGEESKGETQAVTQSESEANTQAEAETSAPLRATSEGLKFETSHDDYVTCQGLWDYSNVPSCIIVDEYEGRPCTSITGLGFGGCEDLTSIVLGASITSIGDNAFLGCYNLKAVYYLGTVEQWETIQIGKFNVQLTDAKRYYYSETEPTDTQHNYWHYVDGVITPWPVS